MSDWYRRTTNHTIASRLLFDYLLVHICMVMTLVGILVWQALVGTGAHLAPMLRTFLRFYTFFSWALAPLFPIALVLSSVKRARYAGQARGAWFGGMGAALACFIGAHYSLPAARALGGPAVFAFCGVVLVAFTALYRFSGSWDSEMTSVSGTGRVASASSEMILVAGGAGYVGSILVRKLLDRGYRVRVVDRFVYGDASLRTIRNHPNLEIIAGDCRKIQDVVSAVRGVRSIVHLAAIVGDAACARDEQAALEINYAATRMLTEVAERNGVSRFVFASSCSVYGANDALVDEESDLNPVSLYAQTKISSERALLRARTDTFHPTVLRLATVFGHSYRPRFDLAVNLLTAKAHVEGMITIYNRDNWRPFVHVQDVAEGIIRVLEAPVIAVSGEIFNLGDSRMNCTLYGVALKIRQVFPKSKVEFVENSDRRNYRVSFDKIRRAVSFQCALGLEDGVREIKRALEQGIVADYRDIRYDNHKYLQALGSPANSNEIDARLMAAILNATGFERSRAAGG
jgi:nucleoside-diphosphate-sugar epimerase